MPNDDFLERTPRVCQIAGKLSGMVATFEKREPEWFCIAILASHTGQIHSPTIDPRWGSRLKAIYCKSKFYNSLGDFYCRILTGSPGWRPGIESEVDESAEERAGGEHHRWCFVAPPVQRHDSAHAAGNHDEGCRRALRNRESCLPLHETPNRPPIETAVALGARRAYGGTLGSIEHPELDSREVGRPSHDATKRVYLAHDRALGDPADRRIALNLTDGFQILGEQQGSRAGASGESGRLHTSVAAADDDDIVPVCHASNLRGGGRNIASGTWLGPGLS